MTNGSDNSGRVISVLEPLSSGIQHVPFNAAMLEVVLLSYPDATVRFYAEPQHVHEVRSVLGKSADRIHWNPIDIPPRDAEFTRRFLFEYRVIRAIARDSSFDRDYLLVLTAIESTILAAKFLHKRGIPLRIQAVLHGYLNGIAGWRSRNPLRRMTDLRAALTRWGNEGLQYLVLEEPIRDYALELLPALSPHLEFVNHPFPSEQASAASQPPMQYPLRIGFLGLATAQKGFDQFVDLAQAVKRVFGDRVEFHAFGRAMSDARDIRFDCLTTAPAAVGLSRNDYLRGVQSLHYVCLPYRGSHYELSASGVLLDALAQLKPMIALPSPVVREMFLRQPSAGYLCETHEQMVDAALRIATTMDAHEYQARVSAVRRLRDERSPESVARRYIDVTRLLK